MALKDLAASLDRGAAPHKTCATCHALEGMSEADAATLRDMLADRAIRFRDLARALASDDDSPTIPEEALSRHARGLCVARERLRA